MLAFYLPILISLGILEVVKANMSASGSLTVRRINRSATDPGHLRNDDVLNHTRHREAVLDT